MLLGNYLKKPLQCVTCPSTQCACPILLLAATGTRCQGVEDNFPMARNICLWQTQKTIMPTNLSCVTFGFTMRLYVGWQ